MGTRSETAFFEGDTELCRIYRQFDGDPVGHGLELAKLCNVTMVNGMSGDADCANGMGCLAARVIAGLKKRPGNIYMASTVYPLDEEYVYEVRWEGGSLPAIKCLSGADVIFDLPADKAVDFCAAD